jgi:hypothetical protein
VIITTYILKTGVELPPETSCVLRITLIMENVKINWDVLSKRLANFGGIYKGVFFSPKCIESKCVILL